MQSLKRESWVSCRVLSVLTEFFFFFHAFSEACIHKGIEEWRKMTLFLPNEIIPDMWYWYSIFWIGYVVCSEINWNSVLHLFSGGVLVLLLFMSVNSFIKWPLLNVTIYTPVCQLRGWSKSFLFQVLWCFTLLITFLQVNNWVLEQVEMCKHLWNIYIYNLISTEKNLSDWYCLGDTSHIIFWEPFSSSFSIPLNKGESSVTLMYLIELWVHINTWDQEMYVEQTSSKNSYYLYHLQMVWCLLQTWFLVF